MTDKEPRSPADPRPGGVPYYIDSHCEVCDAKLILYDDLSDEQRRSSEAFVNPEFDARDDKVWNDEWVCPDCLDGIYTDWPEEYKEKIFGRVEEFDADDWTPLGGI